MAALGYGISPSSADAAEAVEQAATHVGLKAGYLNTTIPFGAVNVEPIVLIMKSANVNAIALEMDNNTNFAVLTAAKQSGLNFKAAVSATGYGQSLLDDTTALADAQGGVLQSIRTAAHQRAGEGLPRHAQEVRELQRRAGLRLVRGLHAGRSHDQGARGGGRNPTRQSFITNLHKVKGNTAGGLLPAPIDLSLADFGQPPAKICGWYATVKGKKFVTVPANGKPVCGVRFSS